MFACLSLQDPAAFLSLVQKTWSAYITQQADLRGVFTYLDRTYVRDTSNVRSLL